MVSPTPTAEGDWPINTLVEGADGEFLGATNAGGANGAGVVYRLRVAP